jgi:hypothetical protein
MKEETFVFDKVSQIASLVPIILVYSKKQSAGFLIKF